MSIETALAELTAAVQANTAILLKLEAGREAAVTALESKTDKPARASRKKADASEDTSGNSTGAAADNAATASTAGAAAAASEPTVSDDDLRNAATTYIQGAGDNTEERKARGANIKSITDHFGTKTLVGETGIQGVDQRVQALFYLKRFAAGASVDFSAEYDFSGDPAQGAAEGGADDFDAIG